MLGICDRSAFVNKYGSTTNVDMWKIKDKYRDIVLKYDPSVAKMRKQEVLEGDESREDGNDGGGKYNVDMGVEAEMKDNAEREFEQLAGLF